ncbi:bifunctional DNA primase/polymerase [Microbacterium sp. zg-YB36]|uniref:bifunctional DNA primase/polymerase n=1 Tax=Microbacterium sp. zg-YB36 TaxID=2969407 RepID=UPI00214B9E14|nr:bifunctional DNA primase/polymerase [Microbacterium sp. zg-YB36]MDL5351125.1 bifunctional DNA primase/polymerase [Microbacterium sp. zg-YB36]
MNSFGGYAAVAQQYRANGFAPIPVIGKGRQEDGTGGLPKGATGREGTVTDEKIAEWIASPFWRDANIALRSDGSWIGIDADAYDGKIGDETLAAMEEELGLLPATISSTSRGIDSPSRIYFFSVPTGLNFVTRFTDVEIVQHSHRYAMVYPSQHPRTGQQYAWYGYEGELLEEIPSVGDFEALPDAWVERLSIPDHDAEGHGFTGGVAEWLEAAPQGQPGFFMAARMGEIPRDRPFGHDEMVSLQASFVSLAASGETGAKAALNTLRKEWLRGEYNTPDYANDFDVSLAGAIAKFGALPDEPEDILTQQQAEIYSRLNSEELFDAWTGLPRVVTPDSLRERVARVMSIAYEQGGSTLDAATLGWHSAAAQHEHGIRQQGLQAVWDLALHVAKSPVVSEQQFAAEPEPEPAVKPEPVRRVSLLNEYERERVADADWWGEEFMRAMAVMNPVLSEPYYRLNRWIALSLCFADKAVIPWTNGTHLILNFYGIMVGPSNSGKTEALEPVKEIARQFWLGMDDPDIGGDATPEALTAALIRRDGKPSLIHADEADAKFRKWADVRGPYSGMPHLITEIYTGNVPAIWRNTQRDISGIHAKAFPNVHMMGIQHKIADAIHPDDWITGYINRFVWANGERKTLTAEQKKAPIRRSGQSASGAKTTNWYQQWTAMFKMIENTTLKPETGQKYAWIDIADDVLDRDVQMKETFEAIAQNSPYEERLEPTFKRLEKTILKCAALVAITKRRRQIEMDDYLIALEQAEEWAENILDMVAATDETPRAREVNKLYDLLVSRGGRMAPSAIHREKAYAGQSKYTKGLIEELVAQGRAEVLPLPGPERAEIIRIVKEEQ